MESLVPMTQERLVSLWEYPSGTGFWSGPWVEMTAADARLYYDYEDDKGAYRWGMLEFKRIRAFQFLDDHSGSHAKGAFSKLVEVVDSPWAKEIHAAMCHVLPSLSHTQLHHYRIFFDDVGRYDMVAESWKNVPRIAAPSETGLVKQLPPHPDSPQEGN